MRRAFVLAAAALLTGGGSAVAQTEAGWMLDAQADCRAWYPTRLIDAAMRWSGSCRRGRADGTGTLEIRLGEKVVERYEGPMRDGAAEGRGKQSWADGTLYDGQFQGGAPNGAGTTTFPGGATYTGEHRVGLPHGAGVYTWRGGARYEGEFSGGRAHGRGTYTVPTVEAASASGAGTYSGRWSNGCFRDGLRWATIGITPRDCGFNIERR
jgi:hypothetical protein